MYHSFCQENIMKLCYIEHGSLWTTTVICTHLTYLQISTQFGFDRSEYVYFRGCGWWTDRTIEITETYRVRGLNSFI